MATPDWRIRGIHLGSCNCAYGCPCEFNAPPTYGPCEGFEVFEIEDGYFGDVTLDGVRFAALFRWPGAIHLGGGFVQTVIDETADAGQREAILTILSGKEQDPGTLFSIIAAITETEAETLYLPIEIAFDIDARTAQTRIPGVLEAKAEPIRNPITGAPHRVSVELPDGFDYREAEFASVDARVTAALTIAYDKRHGSLSLFDYTPRGIGR